jgi:dTDP-D-glucose 4,6-dehydratase
MINNKTILVTGGAGFIGSALIRHIIKDTQHKVVNIDKLTYCGNLQSLKLIEESNNYIFEQIDICQTDEIKKIFPVSDETNFSEKNITKKALKLINENSIDVKEFKEDLIWTLPAYLLVYTCFVYEIIKGALGEHLQKTNFFRV